jgi:hypothetical protein
MRVPRNLELGLNHGDGQVLQRVNCRPPWIDRRLIAEVSFWFGKFFPYRIITRATRPSRVCVVMLGRATEAERFN